MDYCTKGALDAGASKEMATCIAVYCGAGTNIDTCVIVDYAVYWAKSKGVDKSTATKWVNQSMSNLYTWYNDETC